MDNQLNKVFHYLDAEKESLVNLAKRLIEVPTVNPPGLNYDRMAKLLIKECHSIGLKVRRVDVPKDYLKKLGKESSGQMPNILAEWKTGNHPTLHINYHYDVVPATNNWKTDPFKPVVKGGKLYGRGSEDCKGSIASTIYAVKGLVKSGLIPRVNLQISLTPDEETGGRAGMGYLAERGYIKADYALGEGYCGDYISCGNKGVLWAEVEVRGKSCHASEPGRGKNSFEDMLKVGQALERLKKKIEKRITKYPAKYPADRSGTMVLGGIIRGGKAVNVVPDRSVFTIDRRILPEETLTQVKKELQETIKNAAPGNRHKIKARLNIITAEGPVVVSPDKEICRAAKEAVHKVRRKPAHLALTGGVTDMRYLINKGIPSVGYGVSGKERSHADDEFIYVNSLVETSKIIAALIMGLNQEEIKR